MKKVLVISALSLVSLFGQSFIDLGKPEVEEINKGVYSLGKKFEVKTKDYKKGIIKVSLSKEKDFQFDELSQKDFEFIASYFLSTLDSKNSNQIVFYEWENNDGHKFRKVCMKVALKLPDIPQKGSSCPIQKELGTTDISEFIKTNSFEIRCKDL